LRQTAAALGGAFFAFFTAGFLIFHFVQHFLDTAVFAVFVNQFFKFRPDFFQIYFI